MSKKVHVALWGWVTDCGLPLWSPGKRVKTTEDYEKVTCLRCRKVLGLDKKEE